ncbi:MAG: alkaline phosphatase family protein [Muribaculaceae bacterium]|nr:alkaline phosphatase family protein [Muribaculaceae bacterium]
MKKLAIMFMALLGMTTATAQQPVERPRLVVGIVVDQMRWDYLYTYSSMWQADGGIRRLLDGGYSCGNTIIDYVPTYTACGHSCVYTGTTPAFNGIVGNTMMVHGKPMTSVQDTTVVGVGTTTKVGQASPRNLLVTTLGDELRLATAMQARVVGVSLKDRAAILPAGHAANGAFWYDSKVPGFITSTYYMDKLPQWAEQFNKRNKATMTDYDLWNNRNGVTMTFDMAAAAIDGERLGQDGVTDLLAISISTTDYVGHAWSTRSPQLDSIYNQLDIDLGRFLNVLDRKVGPGNYLLFLTADHGATHNYKYMSEHHLPTETMGNTSLEKKINEMVKDKYGIDKVVKAHMGYNWFLDNEAIAEAEADREAIKRDIIAALQHDDRISWVVDCEHPYDQSIPREVVDRVVKGYYPKRCGELYIIPVMGVYSGSHDGKGRTHGTWNQSDSHIPLLFYGWQVPHGERTERNGMVDIAPTVAAMLHIQAPDACIGHPIPFK